MTKARRQTDSPLLLELAVNALHDDVKLETIYDRTI